MKAIYWAAGIAVLSFPTLVACDKIKPPLPQLPAPPAASAPASPQEGGQERQAFAQNFQQELDQLGTKIAELRARVAAAKPQVKEQLVEELNALETRWTEMQQRLPELKSATLETWRQLHESFGKSLDELKSAIQRFAGKTQS